ncbi:MAG: 4Fe-4S binding protein [Lachnospiraceae bacterium]
MAHNTTLPKKLSITQLTRRISQILFFIFWPGLFTILFYALKDLYTSLIQGSFSLAALGGSLLILAGGLLPVLLFGRFFCGYICSFGAMGDFLHFVSQKIFKISFRPSETWDKVLKYMKYIVLAFLVIAIWTFALFSLSSTSNPWTIFGMFSTLWNLSSASYLLTMGGLLLLLIIIGSLFIERFFCRYLCPLGAIFVPLSGLRIFRLKKTRIACNTCQICTKACSMGIPLYRYDSVPPGECINCFSCISSCPRKNVKATPSATLVSAVSVAAVTGLVYAGTILPAGASNQTASAAETTAQGTYTDGTYTGSGTGFRGATEVSVTVSGGQITDITVTAYEDDAQYFQRAQSTVISEILQSQSTEVDTVSGATYSSNSIIAAVADALGISYTNPNSSINTQQSGHSGRP